MSQAYNRMSYVEVAKRYNDINHIPLDAATNLGKAVAELAGDGAQIVDLGGGAGRISVPVAACLDTVAMDIEHHMLRASSALAAQRSVSIGLCVGTVLRLPFADDRFDAVLITNVLHQVEGWRDALAETARILKPGGVLIMGRDILDEESCAGRLRQQSRQITAEVAPEMLPTDAAGPALFQHLMAMGGQGGPPVTACAWTERLSPRKILERMAERTHNETWSLDDAQLDGLMKRIRPWAEASFDDLDAEEEVHWSFGLSAIHGLA